MVEDNCRPKRRQIRGQLSSIEDDVCLYKKAIYHFLYSTAAPSAEYQHPEAWPASTYGHFKEGYLIMKSSFH